ncbi:MAG: GNAT family N-acetyltransferase [Bacteroidota bacterium]|nr:GNAT family N-acetyltransferase [Bacteroidota bacterium]
MNIVIEKLTTNKVFSLLEETDLLYTPALSNNVDLREYSKKLSDNADFVLCNDEEKISGYVAYYSNIEKKELYIPLICVKQEYQCKGLATRMLSLLENSMGGGEEEVF